MNAILNSPCQRNMVSTLIAIPVGAIAFMAALGVLDYATASLIVV